MLPSISIPLFTFRFFLLFCFAESMTAKPLRSLANSITSGRTSWSGTRGGVSTSGAWYHSESSSSHSISRPACSTRFFPLPHSRKTPTEAPRPPAPARARRNGGTDRSMGGLPRAFLGPGKTLISKCWPLDHATIEEQELLRVLNVLFMLRFPSVSNAFCK